MTVTPSFRNFNTGNTNNAHTDSNSWNVNIAPPTNTPAGVYTTTIFAVPNTSSVRKGLGTAIQLTVSADSAPPSTSLSAVDASNNPYSGVNFVSTAKVTITLTATDAGGSGVADARYKVDNGQFKSYSGPFDIANEGLSVVTYFSIDNTGAQETAHFFTVKIDRTAPSISCGAADGQWHASDVSIPCTSSDGGSGLANASDASFSLSTSVPANTEDPNASTDSRQVCDAVGHCSAAGPVSGNKVDKKPPTVTASAALADNSPYSAGGWTNQSVVVSYQCSDGGSGVASVDGPSTLSAEGANQSATGNCTDNVGNAAHTTFSTVNIDKTAPMISASRSPAANGFGWNNTDVTASYTAGDTLSGLSDPASGSFTFTTEGSNQSHIFTVHDRAGNTASATVSGVNIDKTAPNVNINSPTAGTYLLNQSVAASYSCGDGGNPPSGVDTCTGPVGNGAAIDTSSVGSHTFNVTAKDQAGNPYSKSVTYGVVYDWSGYLQPINLDGSSVFKLGSTVPVKFRLVGGSAGVTNATGFTLWVAKVSNNVVGSEVEAVTSTPASTGNLFRYDPTSGQYIYNMGTKGASWTAGTWQLRVDLGDGAPPRIVLISLKP
ncbi:MAG TPA: PxKF domain-containing protein [Pyrinomonadaceae bacterium]|nr:PxKF domain-containing protein [Pyrinomonadaceae bacterium]